MEMGHQVYHRLLLGGNLSLTELLSAGGICDDFDLAGNAASRVTPPYPSESCLNISEGIPNQVETGFYQNVGGMCFRLGGN